MKITRRVNHGRSLRTRNSKTFAFLFVLIAVMLLTASPAFSSMMRCSKSPHPVLPEARNYQYQEQRGAYPTIIIDAKGNTWLEGERFDNTPDAVEMLEDRIEESCGSRKKVFLKADGEVPFGKIVEVLNVLSKAQIKEVGLITGEWAAPIHFFKDLNTIWAGK